MDGVAGQVESMSRVVRGVLERARAGGDDVGRVDVVREAIVEVGRAAQALHGMLLTLVGEGDRLGIARGGVGPWLATVLDVTEGRARALAHDARLLARLPGVEGELCSGMIGPDSARALARTVKAVRATGLDPAVEAAKTLEVTRERGARAGLERVRVLEEQVAPGSIEARHARERERSFARITTCGEGQMHRCEILLDPVRGAVFQAAVDLQVAEMIRVRQFDGGEIVPEDVRSTEQMNAEAVTRLAQVFLDAPPEQRHAHFSLPALAVTIEPPAPAAAVKNPAVPAAAVKDPSAHVAGMKDPSAHVAGMKDPSAHVAGMKDPAVHAEIPAGCARTVFGALVPAGRLPKRGDPRRHELVTDGRTGTFDGVALDHDPRARLASPAQRGFLAWRDRYCTYPGCDRPLTFALHAHHIVPFAHGGETRVGNLRLYCAKHHTTVHQER
ncbi:HNH endonuclease signature motif containing protein [Actinospica robiniae]|uniref:HNH endonuclease signature motif containing protein n=1 Tax=Actinospica robiniae TaxID=304901 RepID=UPI000428F974|nr:HNH endonuclease signature motif containing protein [Actinospica robiniae]